MRLRPRQRLPRRPSKLLQLKIEMELGKTNGSQQLTSCWSAVAADLIYNACKADHGKFSWERLERTLPEGWKVLHDADGRPLSNQDGAILRAPSGQIIAAAAGTRATTAQRSVADLFNDLRGWAQFDQ